MFCGKNHKHGPQCNHIFFNTPKSRGIYTIPEEDESLERDSQSSTNGSGKAELPQNSNTQTTLPQIPVDKGIGFTVTSSLWSKKSARK